MQLSIFCWKRHGSNTNSVAGYDKELLLSLSEGFCFCHHLFTGLRCMLLKSHKMYLISKLWNFLSRCVLTFWAVTNFGCADVTIFKVQGTCNQCYFQPKCREVKINWNFCIFSPSQVEFCSALFMEGKPTPQGPTPQTVFTKLDCCAPVLYWPPKCLLTTFPIPSSMKLNHCWWQMSVQNLEILPSQLLKGL